MKDAFGVSKAISPAGAKTIAAYSGGARLGSAKKPLRLRAAQSGTKQVDTPENAMRKVKDASNARTSANSRDIASWQKSGYKAFPKPRTV
jgi:hypothetical protein